MDKVELPKDLHGFLHRAPFLVILAMWRFVVTTGLVGIAIVGNLLMISGAGMAFLLVCMRWRLG